jgi:hypothetical protein
VELDIVIDNLVISHLSNFSIDKVNAKNIPSKNLLKKTLFLHLYELYCTRRIPVIFS